jgi:hypothetical protein
MKRDTGADPRVSVLMPTHDHAAFIARAVSSLRAGRLNAWELIIVEDGRAGADADADVLARFIGDPRIRIVRLDRNQGLGAALNIGLDHARAALIAYLPSDDVYYPEHLESLVGLLDREPDAVLAYSGVRHHYNRTSPGGIDGTWLQLVQVVHRRTPDRWLERADLVTDRLDWMYWNGLRRRGAFAGTGEVTCEWVDHPGQRHKLLREPAGGINLYRQRYRIAHPLHFHTSVGNRIDEGERYRQFRERPDTPPAPDGLRIVLAGELAYNAERVLALEERGHRLFGLWMPDPYWYNTVGPLPFGHVTDLPSDDPARALERPRPDVVYGLLNWQAVPFCAAVRRAAARLGIPFVWHFKEGPFICLERGTWPALAELHAHADGVIYCSHEMRDWFRTAIPAPTRAPHEMVLDGDLPKREWFTGARSPRLSESDGEIHTVVPGRPIGLHPEDVAALAREQVHLHFYGDFTHGQWLAWIDRAARLAPAHLHLHEQVDQDGWVREFSRYDAGWLHVFASENGGDIRRASWDDLNLPARLSTFAAAGLPVIQRSNEGAAVATARLARELGMGVCCDDYRELAARLRDEAGMRVLRSRVWQARDGFTFDAHADELVSFFRAVIADSPRPRPRRSGAVHAAKALETKS